jgi:hypothetical protein
MRKIEMMEFGAQSRPYTLPESCGKPISKAPNQPNHDQDKVGQHESDYERSCDQVGHVGHPFILYDACGGPKVRMSHLHSGSPDISIGYCPKLL